MKKLPQDQGTTRSQHPRQGVHKPSEGKRISTKPRYCFLWQVR